MSAGDPDGRGTRDGAGDGDEEGEWRFGLEDVGPEAEPPEPEPVEPEPIDRENALFFVLGVLFALVAFGSLLV